MELEHHFKSVQILRDQPLGVGAYGQVCKAKCDDLLCAAKMIHAVLFDVVIHHNEGLSPIKQFEYECELLSGLRHPNIVQYFGVYRDPEAKGLPVLLMELMDVNFTRYLERSSQPLPYHLQVNICHDIALALSYIHTRDIVHRDVSSGCILLTASYPQVAKLSDFGVAVVNISSQIDLAMCPGTIAYMPPEAMTNDPVYTEKIDCFSFGVIVIQILTREFPRPDSQTKLINDPRIGYAQTAVPVRISEVQRRQNHITKVDPGNTLLPIALDCLKDKGVERPTAHQLCERIGALRESERYVDSKKRSSLSDESGAELRKQLVTERQQHTLEQEHNREEIHRLREEIKQKEVVLTDVFENAERQQLDSERELQNERRQISQLEQQLKQEQVQSSQRERELRQQISDMQQHILVEQQRATRDRDQLYEKEERIRELELRLEQSEVEGLGSRVTGLQLLPQGDSWNVPRREIQITEQIGEGGSGLVSKGRFQGQVVAVKQIHRWLLRQVYSLNEFKREVGIMATIQHPNLVRFIAAVFDERVDQHLDSPLLVLELLHTNLRDAYKDYNLSPSKSVPIFRDVAYGLHYLHEHSEPIIHRDVSAPNVLLESLPGDTWRAKLSDFGSANFLKRAKTFGVGAIVYTAPEMFPREGPSAPMPRPTTKCDVFSYGIVVVEVITKTMPTTENRHELFGEVERKWRLMYDLVSQCTQVSPHARPTMADVLNILNRIPTARPR